MKIWTIVPLVLMVCGIASAQTDQTKYDGYWWARQSEEFKIGWVVGYVNAKDNDLAYVLFSCMAAKFANEAHRGPCEHPGYSMNFEKVTFGQYVEGIDSFFKDFRNRQLNVYSAMEYVRDQVTGVPQSELDKEVEQWRRCQSDSKLCIEAPKPAPTSN